MLNMRLARGITQRGEPFTGPPSRLTHLHLIVGG